MQLQRHTYARQRGIYATLICSCSYQTLAEPYSSPSQMPYSRMNMPGNNKKKKFGIQGLITVNKRRKKKLLPTQQLGRQPPNFVISLQHKKTNVKRRGKKYTGKRYHRRRRTKTTPTPTPFKLAYECNATSCLKPPYGFDIQVADGTGEGLKKMNVLIWLFW